MSSKVITPALLESLIASKEFHLFKGTTTMVCVLTLINGFAVTGTSNSAPGTTFDPHLGMEYAEVEALQKVAELAAFMLREIETGDGRAIFLVRQAVTNLKLKELENGN